MGKLSFDYKNALGFISEHEISYLEPQVLSAHNMVHERSGPGSDYLGWVELPMGTTGEFSRIQKPLRRYVRIRMF